MSNQLLLISLHAMHRIHVHVLLLLFVFKPDSMSIISERRKEEEEEEDNLTGIVN